MFWNGYTNSKVIFWRKRYWDMKFQWLKPVYNQKIIKILTSSILHFTIEVLFPWELGCNQAWLMITNSTRGVSWWMYSTSLISIPWAVCLEMCGYNDRWADRWMNIRMNGQTSPYLRKWRTWHQVYLPSPGQFMVCYPITITLLLRGVSVSPWSRYDDSMCEITQLHVINNVAWTKGGVIFPASSNAFLLKKFVLQISPNYDPDFPTNNQSALVQVMTLLMHVVPSSFCRLSVVISCKFCIGMMVTQDYLFMIYFHPCWLMN